MTAKELIEHLQTLSPDTRICVKGYEDGVDYVSLIRKAKILKDRNSEWYYVETLGRKYPELGSWFIWDKYSDLERVGLLDGKLGSAFETCWSKAKHARELVRVLVTTNYTARGDETRVHPTQKPVELAAWFISRFSKSNNLIVDLFGGSVSTLIACEQTNRVCYMMELDPKYCDVIIARWEKLTGETAVLVEG